MENLAKSELIIAKILDRAMEQGIQDWSLKFSDLELGEEYAPFFFSCLEWLEAEGVIRVGDYSRAISGVANGWARNVTLTSYGMIALGHKIEIGDEEELMSDAVKKVSSGERSYSQIGDFVGGLMGGFTKSLGSG